MIKLKNLQHKKLLKYLCVLIILGIVITKSYKELNSYIVETYVKPFNISFEKRVQYHFNSPIAGYAKKNSLYAGEPLVIRVASRLNDKSKSIISYNIIDYVTQKSIKKLDFSENDSPEIFPELCESAYRGCDFRGRISISTNKFSPGFYNVILKSEKGSRSSPIFFNILPNMGDLSEYAVAVIAPTFTWQAYNNLGAQSLYMGPISYGLYSANLDRPLRNPEGEEAPNGFVSFLKQLRNLEYKYFVLTSMDLHTRPKLIDKAKIVVLGPHDEYWTQEMYDNLNIFLNRKGHVAIFGGNSLWWKAKVTGRNINVIKEKTSLALPFYPNWHNTGQWRDRFGLFQENVLGASYEFGGLALKEQIGPREFVKLGLSKSEYDQSSGMTVIDSEHPIFASTGLKNNEIFGVESEIMFDEIDGIPINSSTLFGKRKMPSKEFMQLLARGRVYRRVKVEINGVEQIVPKTFMVGTIVELRAPNRGTILNLGSMGWARSIRIGDNITSQIFKNALNYLLKQDSNLANKQN